MKKSLIKELRAKTDAELKKMLDNQKEDFTRVLIDLKSGKLRNTALVANKKRMMAVISTLLAEKELVKQ